MTATLTAPTVRVVPAPRSEPLTDDERHGRGLDGPVTAAPLLPLDLPGAASRRRATLVRLTGGASTAYGPTGTGAARPRPERGELGGFELAGSELAGGGPVGGGPAGVGPAGSPGVSSHELPSPALLSLRVDLAGPPARDGVLGLADVLAGAAHAEPPAAVRPVVSPARPATRVFLATCVEVMGGFRPMSQLRSLCVPDRFTEIADRLAAHPATSPAGRGGSLAYRTTRTPMAGRTTGAPPRLPRNNQAGPIDRAGVRRVQICDIGPRVAEVAVVLGRRDQVWAMALRFEIHRGRWLCSLLQVV